MHDLDDPEQLKLACAWMMASIKLVPDGCPWEIPLTGATYTFHHSTKTAHRWSSVAHEETDRVLRALGYMVIDPRHH